MRDGGIIFAFVVTAVIIFWLRLTMGEPQAVWFWGLVQ